MSKILFRRAWVNGKYDDDGKEGTENESKEILEEEIKRNDEKVKKEIDSKDVDEKEVSKNPGKKVLKDRA